MPVPGAISDLSQTAASNSPPGSESPTTADDYLRAYAAFIATLRDGKGFTDPVQLASGATADIGGQNALFVEITGTTTITSFGTNYNGPRFLRFTGALTLTHNATTVNLPGAANITTAAGDTAIAIPNQAGNGWNVAQYQRAAGVPSFNGPTFSAYQSTLQSLSTGVFTKVTFTTEEWDLGGMYDTATSKFTPTVAGYYQVNAAVGNATAPAPYIVSLYKNGSEYKRGVHFNSSSIGTNVSALVFLNGSTDFIEVYAFQGSGGSVNTAATANQTYFQCSFVRAA